MAAMESWQRVASNVRGGIAEGCGHWIPEERPEWVVEHLLAFFGEEGVCRCRLTRCVPALSYLLRPDCGRSKGDEAAFG